MTTASNSTNANPLLDFSGLPAFDRIEPTHIAPALDVLLAEARASLERVVDAAGPVSWDAIVTPLEDATEKLGRAWGIVGHLNAVADSPELREAYNANLPRMTQFWTEVSQDTRLFARYKALRASAQFDGLDAARRKVIENALRDFRLGGAELVSPARERYAEIQDRAAALAQKFSENVLDGTNAFELLLDSAEALAGVPADAIDAARASAEQAGKPGYRLTLQFPSYLPVMQYATDRALREKLYRAYTTRSSEHPAAPRDATAAARLDNGPVMAELLRLRHEEAQLLGYDNFAEVSLVPKMADSPAQVTDFLRDLARRARPFAERDLDELRTFARARLHIDTLEPWDMAYASEHLKQERYAFSDTELKQYFQLPRVLDGLFSVARHLFGVDVRPDAAPVWHPDVRFFRVERDGALIGHFYLDPYARPSKRPGAWMDDARGRRRDATRVQTPIAWLVCNFQPPVGERPALLTHDDALTLFHEFGHGLHHLLTQVDELAVSGISGVEWDAVELPSQFMENFCWEWDNLAAMTAHIDTGEPLPRALYERMLAAKNFQAGMATLRQVEFALFDMLLHTRDIADATDVQALLDVVRKEVAVVPVPAWNRFQNSFSHIFGGGYAAGYYSYKWAEVLSADAYAAFEEAGQAAEPSVATARTGRRFMSEILAVGGSRPAIESFRAFRGRDPDITALLRHHGMVETT